VDACAAYDRLARSLPNLSSEPSLHHAAPLWPTILRAFACNSIPDVSEALLNELRIKNGTVIERIGLPG
jgi:hypothetical protein